MFEFFLFDVLCIGDNALSNQGSMLNSYNKIIDGNNDYLPPYKICAAYTIIPSLILFRLKNHFLPIY